VTKALRYSLRATREFFGASHAAVAVARPGETQAAVLLAIPDDRGWNLDLLARFIRSRYPQIPEDILIAPLRRGGRTWAAIALRRVEPFDRGAIRVLLEVAATISESIERIDLERMLEVRDRIDRKMMEQLRAKDLFYQILDGLRSLTRYDHSSALLIQDEDGTLRLVAEQIAWVKGKSRRIGLGLALTEEVRAAIGAGEVFGFERSRDGWTEWKKRPVTSVAELLDYNRGEGEVPEAREGSMLCAPLATADGLLGVLKVASRHPGTFGPYEAGLVERFRSHVALAIRNSQRVESFHARMVEAERKHAMADLARSVAHDVNNALGSVLPLVQQMHADARDGRTDPSELRSDLEQIQRSLEVCRRIFGGMLSFARSGARDGAGATGRSRIAPAVESTIAILRDGFERIGITVEVALADGLPPVVGHLSELEQVFLNLLTNAKEAMPHGGTIVVRGTPVPGGLEITIDDTGIGIPAELLERVQEPFVTTKEHGSGLGLAICRSTVWGMGGRIRLESEPGRGTRVHVFLPGADSERLN
jgi:signal transduction histidine kinase